jgi:hypothetical protein
MPQLINLIIAIVIFAIAAYGLYWINIKFELPKPVLWICGALLIIVVLLYISGQIHLPGFVPGFWYLRN